MSSVIQGKTSRLSRLSTFIRDRFTYPGEPIGLDQKLKALDDRITYLIYKKIKEEKLKALYENTDMEIDKVESEYKKIQEEEKRLKRRLRKNKSMGPTNFENKKKVRRRRSQKATRFEDSRIALKRKIIKREKNPPKNKELDYGKSKEKSVKIKSRKEVSLKSKVKRPQFKKQKNDNKNNKNEFDIEKYDIDLRKMTLYPIKQIKKSLKYMNNLS